jgi:hypothetical protein
MNARAVFQVTRGSVVAAGILAIGVWAQSASPASSALETCEAEARVLDPISLYGDEMEFSVLRDGDPIGVHRVTFNRDGDRLIVGSRFEAQVKLLFVTVYEYLYESKSVWRDGCLVELRATTDDNGDKSSVSAWLDNGRLTIQGPSGVTQGDAELFPTDHWNAGVLQTNRVLNTITGSVAAVTIADMGKGQVMVNNAPGPARHYVYSGDLRTEVWYDENGRWVKMRFRADDGSSIEYVCRKCRRDAPSNPA